MLNAELRKEDGILIVSPGDALQASDFEQLSTRVDPFIEENGALNGLMIYTESFPGWENFAGLVSHIKFVKNHHKHIKKVAAVTDSGIASFLPNRGWNPSTVQIGTWSSANNRFSSSSWRHLPGA